MSSSYGRSRRGMAATSGDGMADQSGQATATQGLEKVSHARSKWRRATTICLAAVVASLSLQLAIIHRHGLWTDEVFSLAMATGHSLEHPSRVADPALG